MTLHDELAGLAAKLRDSFLYDQMHYAADPLLDEAATALLNAADEVKRLREALGTIAAGDVPISVSPDLAVRYEKFARAALTRAKENSNG